ncbi:MAG: glutamyl-tRNA reductase [Pirellulales bacterium]|nr:glutamyl-tRNA reductase [Pirellulales bacterium]
MSVRMIGCSHRDAPIEVRERVALGHCQLTPALAAWQERFAAVEAVVLSTCNRVEFYLAADDAALPETDAVAAFLAAFHGLAPEEVLPHLRRKDGREAVSHLFRVAASLDSMVLGEAQILGQVKDAYERARQQDAVGPTLHGLFQAALRVARCVASQTELHQHRVSVPSVAVGEFARQIFDRFDDKNALVIGAGEMAEETVRYLREEGIRDLVVANRSAQRAETLAEHWNARAAPWNELARALAEADLVVSATGAGRPIVSAAEFSAVEAARAGRPLFILDLAVPRDFEPTIAQRPDVYLYSIDDLQSTCQTNRRHRDKELPKADRIVDAEVDRYLEESRHQTGGPIIRRLREVWQQPKEEELERLFRKLADLPEPARAEIRRSFDRLINKLLHPPLESLRNESRRGTSSALLEALAKLFQLKD